MGSSYSSIERLFARSLSATPGIKMVLKRVYQYCNWVLHRKQYRVSPESLDIHRCLDLEMETFFGYYDKSPLNASNEYLLCHGTSRSTKEKPDLDSSVDILLVDFSTNNLVTRLQSKAYNWQQGTRLQWLNDDLFIYNDYDSDNRRYIARVFSASNQKEIKVFSTPVQDSYKTEYFLSVNYSRLYTLSPEYGYGNLPSLSSSELLEDKYDGIWKVDFETGSSVLLYSLQKIISQDFRSEFTGALHNVNHVMISPSGKQFIFIHRYYVRNRRLDRLVLASIDGEMLKIIMDHGLVSHCCWVDEDRILGYLRGPDGATDYYLIDLGTGLSSKLILTDAARYGDGHPQVFGDWFVTDSYPDKSRMQHLRLYNWKTGKVRNLVEVYHGLEYHGGSRCDLHPRFSSDGSKVFFDSTFSGERQLYWIDV